VPASAKTNTGNEPTRALLLRQTYGKCQKKKGGVSNYNYENGAKELNVKGILRSRRRGES